MLQNIEELLGAKLAAADGEIGKIKDLYFDDSYEESKVYVDLTLADLKATGENEVAAVGGSNAAATSSRS